MDQKKENSVSVQMSAEGSPYKFNLRRSEKLMGIDIISSENFFYSANPSGLAKIGKNNMTQNLSFVAVGKSNTKALIAGLKACVQRLEELEDMVEVKKDV